MAGRISCAPREADRRRSVVSDRTVPSCSDAALPCSAPETVGRPRRMAIYSLVFNPDRSIYEEVQDDIGGHAIFGFQTEAAAKAWIAEDPIWPKPCGIYCAIGTG